MLSPNPFSFLLTLHDTDDFFVAYLLRLYNVANAQVAPLLAAVGAGVVDYPDTNALNVSAASSGITGGFVVAPGLAIVEAQDYGPAFILLREPFAISWEDVAFDYESWQSDGGPRYILALGAWGDGETGTDSRGDNSFELVVGELPAQDGAVLLARLELDAQSQPALYDERAPSHLADLRQRIETLTGKIIDILERLSKLEAPIDGTGADEDFNARTAIVALTNRVAQNETDIAALKAQIAVLLLGNDLFPPPFDLLSEAFGALAGGLGEVNPPAIERLQLSVVGPNFGHGQNSTPDWTPDSGGELEMPFNPETGSFGL